LPLKTLFTFAGYILNYVFKKYGEIDFIIIGITFCLEEALKGNLIERNSNKVFVSTKVRSTMKTDDLTFLQVSRKAVVQAGRH
jgi:enoyl-[acyl-carrier-protein] reductase (NADH)